MESLVDEKVDAFWKGVDSGASKSGQVIVTFSEKKQKKTTWFQVYAGEVRRMVPSLPVRAPSTHRDFHRKRFRGSNGSLIPSSGSHHLSVRRRIISAEIRQPKSDEGVRCPQ
jgi:hypothetical protein